jgi:hypothetical protein
VQEARKLYHERHAQGQDRQKATGGKEMDAATVDIWARLAMSPQMMSPQIKSTILPLPLPFAADAHTIRAHEDWAEKASGVEAVCPRAQMASGVEPLSGSGVAAVSLPVSLPTPPLPHCLKTMAEEGLKKAQLPALACVPPLKHVACVPPLKLSFLVDEPGRKETPTPAVRGVRTQWPLLGRS